MIKALSPALPCGVAMSGMVKAIGRGLFSAGLLLLLLYFVGLHLTGLDALRDALYPFAVRTYLPLLLLAPGVLRPRKWLASLLPFQRFFCPQQLTEPTSPRTAPPLRQIPQLITHASTWTALRPAARAMLAQVDPLFNKGDIAR